MASESTDEETLQVSVPRDLSAWLDDRAAALDVDRSSVLEQLLASYRATAALDGEGDATALAVDLSDDEALDDRIRTAVDERIAEVVDDRLADAVDAALADRDPETAAEVREELAAELEALGTDVDEKIQDVRERVIQVKRETDTKAPADHTHGGLDRIDGLVTRVAELESAVGTLEGTLDAEREERTEAVGDLEERLDDVADRLQTVAWVVNDLRDAYESHGGPEALDRLKLAAARADVDRARCENCGGGVTIALLTEPTCPHCEATVADVEPAQGFFGKPQLLVASQLESGERP